MKNFIKNNPFLILATVCTVIVSISHFFVDVCCIFLNSELSIIFGIFILFVVAPVAIILLLNTLWIFLKNKYSKKQLMIKIISFFVNFSIIFVQLFLLAVHFSFYYLITHPDWYDEYKPITDTTRYIEAKNKIGKVRETKHFPANIPDKAQNIRLYEYYWTFKDYSAILLLKFDIDNNYIENEIKKNKCTNLMTPNSDNHKYKEIESELNEIRDNKYYEASNYTFCELNQNNVPESRLKKNYGIAFKNNQIVYYYSKKNW